MKQTKLFFFFRCRKTWRSRDNLDYWLGIDAVNGDFEKLRDDIVAKLLPLIDSLEH